MHLSSVKTTSPWLLKSRPLTLVPTSLTPAKLSGVAAVKSPSKSTSVASVLNRNDRLPAKVVPLSAAKVAPLLKLFSLNNRLPSGFDAVGWPSEEHPAFKN